VDGNVLGNNIPFKLEGFDKDLVEAGGWLEYAEQHY
jgi:hypothetical protein